MWNTDLVDAINSINVSANGATWIGGIAASTLQVGVNAQSLEGHLLTAQLNRASTGTHDFFSPRSSIRRSSVADRLSSRTRSASWSMAPRRAGRSTMPCM